MKTIIILSLFGLFVSCASNQGKESCKRESCSKEKCSKEKCSKEKCEKRHPKHPKFMHEHGVFPADRLR